MTTVSKGNYFGTDGVRGRANVGKMTPDNVMRLAMAAGKQVRRSDASSVVIGKDTRVSGDMIESALVAGFTSVGMDVKLFGILPTSGVSLMTEALGADLGVMITASHNIYSDNGIKLFGPDGRKLDDEAQGQIERGLVSETLMDDLAEGEALGHVVRHDDLQSRYVELVSSTFPRGTQLSGLKIVLDCANGAAYETAPATFRALGADTVIPIGISPDGTNINRDCGSTHTELLSRTVVAEGADLGVALDGDADRLIMCDERGHIIDGDQLLALMATSWAARGLLSRPGIVATVMSNLGLERYLRGQGLELVRTAVGDRHVAARMRADGYNIGGEQSGHLLMTDHSPTGDGTMAALQVMAEILRLGRPASEVLDMFEPVPQLLKNVRYSGDNPLAHPDVVAAIRDAEADMGEAGRILVRASGTEPLIRVMAEGDDAALVERVTDELAEVIAKAT